MKILNYYLNGFFVNGETELGVLLTYTGTSSVGSGFKTLTPRSALQGLELYLQASMWN